MTPRTKPTPSTKLKKRASMPATTLVPLSGRRRIKKIRARVSAALALDPSLYEAALKRAAAKNDNNFSAYVRDLIRKDIGIAA